MALYMPDPRGAVHVGASQFLSVGWLVDWLDGWSVGGLVGRSVMLVFLGTFEVLLGFLWGTFEEKKWYFLVLLVNSVTFFG